MGRPPDAKRRPGGNRTALTNQSLTRHRIAGTVLIALFAIQIVFAAVLIVALATGWGRS